VDALEALRDHLCAGASVARTPVVSEALAKVGLGKAKDKGQDPPLEFAAAEVAAARCRCR